MSGLESLQSIDFVLLSRLACHDVVLTTYGVVRSESAALNGASVSKKGKASSPSSEDDSDVRDGSDDEYLPKSLSATTKKGQRKAKSKGDWPLFEVSGLVRLWTLLNSIILLPTFGALVLLRVPGIRLGCRTYRFSLADKGKK